MPILILLNGGPASGKSTLARRWARARPLALALDVDIVRAMLGDWEADPAGAGRAARALALSMARTHLAAGRDVVVPQYLARPDFIDQLDAVASDVGAVFLEVALQVDAEVADRRFRERGAADVHGGLGGEMADVLREHERFLSTREHLHRIRSIEGDIDAAVRELDALVAR